MTRKRQTIPEDIFKPDPALDDRIRKVIQAFTSGVDEDELAEQEWRDRMARLDARISRLEEAVDKKYVHKRGITDTEEGG